MKLTPDQTDILRKGLIAQCAAAGNIGMPLATLRLGARNAGFGGIEDEDLGPHLNFLVLDQKLSVSGSVVAAALKRWYITADGVRFAEEQGLI